MESSTEEVGLILPVFLRTLPDMLREIRQHQVSSCAQRKAHGEQLGTCKNLGSFAFFYVDVFEFLCVMSLRKIASSFQIHPSEDEPV